MSIDLDRKEGGGSSEAHGGYSGMYDEGEQGAWGARDEEARAGSSSQPSSPPLGGREGHRGV